MVCTSLLLIWSQKASRGLSFQIFCPNKHSYDEEDDDAADDGNDDDGDDDDVDDDYQNDDQYDDDDGVCRRKKMSVTGQIPDFLSK